MKTAAGKAIIPLLIPCLAGEAGEEFLPGVQLRELAWAEARDLLAAENLKAEFSAREVRNMLRKVELIALPGSGKTSLALYAKDLQVAAYVRYLVRLEGECGIARCPQCGNWFVQQHCNQVYDTPAHRDYHRVVRWRAVKKKQKTREKKSARQVIDPNLSLY